MPFALAVVRSLGAAGHEVVATDSVPMAPAMHSKLALHHEVTVAPRDDPPRYADEIAEIYSKHEIELHVPTFEESFFLAAHDDDLGDDVPRFLPAFETLLELHSKERFMALCERLGIRAPKTRVVTGQAGLREATEEFPTYCARASFSRGAVQLLTNAGPRAGHVKVEECEPTASNPWLVQEYVEGTDLCSYSIVRDGRVVAHLTYEIPIQIDHAAGVQFETIQEPATLEAAATIARETGYHGNLSLDWKRDDEGLCAIECNPRVTNGANTMHPEVMAAALTGELTGVEPVVTEPGRMAQEDLGVVAEMLTRQMPVVKGVKELLRVRDMYAQHGDLLPELYQYFQFVHDVRTAHEHRVGFMDAMQYDTCWDGDPIP